MKFHLFKHVSCTLNSYIMYSHLSRRQESTPKKSSSSVCDSAPPGLTDNRDMVQLIAVSCLYDHPSTAPKLQCRAAHRPVVWVSLAATFRGGLVAAAALTAAAPCTAKQLPGPGASS